jgi:NTE family protein
MKIGFALSGGGARGIAHLGVFKAFKDAGISPSVISGTSAGAVAGAFIAAGKSPEEALGFLKKNTFPSVLRLAMNRFGLMNLSKLEALYSKVLGDSIENLDIPLIICATDILESKSVYFSKGKLIRPLLASSTIPVFFEPVPYKEMMLVDGGLLNNLPVEPLEHKCDIIIGVHTNPIREIRKLRSLKNMIERTFLIIVSNTVTHRKTMCDIFIEPEGLEQFGIFDFSKADQIFELGYIAALDVAKKVKFSIENIHP